MKKFLLFSGALIISSFLYLYQRVCLYIEAYNLNKNYKMLKEYIDKRDALLYNFYQKVSLEKVNKWVDNNGFKLIEKERWLALNLKKEEKKNQIKKGIIENIRISFNKLLHNSYASSEEMKERQVFHQIIFKKKQK